MHVDLRHTLHHRVEIVVAEVLADRTDSSRYLAPGMVDRDRALQLSVAHDAFR